jgi:hypothetical protein
MCRSIKQLRNPDNFPDDDEIHAAALQYIRKVSGYRKPSQKNKEVFDQAVSAVANTTRILLENIQQTPLRK